MYAVDETGTLRLLTVSPTPEIAGSVLAALQTQYSVPTFKSELDEMPGTTIEDMAVPDE